MKIPNNLGQTILGTFVISLIITVIFFTCSGRLNGPKERLQSQKMVCVGLIVRTEGSRHSEHDVEYMLLQDDSGYIKHVAYNLNPTVKFHDTVITFRYRQRIFDGPDAGEHIFIDTVINLNK